MGYGGARACRTFVLPTRSVQVLHGESSGAKLRKALSSD